jgi:hypothetical protein
MEFKDLRKDYRYLFYLNVNDRKFRGTFIDIIENTLRVCKYEENNILCKSLMHTLPLEWIKKIENLTIITEEKILSNDILNEIDLFF